MWKKAQLFKVNSRKQYHYRFCSLPVYIFVYENIYQVYKTSVNNIYIHKWTPKTAQLLAGKPALK